MADAAQTPCPRGQMKMGHSTGFASLNPLCLHRLDRRYVSCLPTLRPLDYVELHSLTFLEALEAG